MRGAHARSSCSRKIRPRVRPLRSADALHAPRSSSASSELIVRRRAMKYLMAALALSVCARASFAAVCNPDHVDMAKERASATADSMANLRGAPGSLKAELSRLLNDAQQGVKRATPPTESCRQSCTAVGPPRITISVVPNRLLKSYQDAEKCVQRLTQTSAQPLRFGPRRVKTENELGNWIAEVSQGHGEDGALLYEKCDGKCSPRYFIEAAPDGHGIVGSMSVVCGPARDKDDNTYTVLSGYRWGCRTRQ